LFVSYAQNFEDVMLWRALGRVARGRYVDVGAHDPLVDSVSHAFYERGWRGVHVEPSASYASKLRQARPDETVIEAVAGKKAGSMKFFDIPGTGLSTADEKIADRHAKAGYKVVETRVDCVTLDSVLAQAEPEIHWLKIDVEGLEKTVLAGWKGKVRPWIVVIESILPSTNEKSHKAWEPALIAKGYRFAHFDGLNRFYVSQGHADLIGAFESGPNVFDGFVLSGTASSSFASALAEKNRKLKAESDRVQAENREAKEREHKYLLKLDDARQAALTATQEASRREAERARLLHEAQQIAMRSVQTATERLQQMASEREAERKEFTALSTDMAARERTLLEERDSAQKASLLQAQAAALRERALMEHQQGLQEQTKQMLEHQKGLQQQTQQLAAWHRARLLEFAEQLSGIVSLQRDGAVQGFQPSASGRYTLAELCAYEGEAFVHAAYRALLRRAPDASGFANYLDHLGRGMPKQQILGGIRWSEEGRACRVKVEGLGTAYALRLAAGVPVLGVIARFVLGMFYLTNIEAEHAAARSRMAIAAEYREREARDLLESMLRRMNEAGIEGSAPTGIAQSDPALPAEASGRGAELRNEIRKWSLGRRADE